MKRVAIVGSGIVGTTIAHLLVEHGVEVELFEKGLETPYPHREQYAERVLYRYDNPDRRLPRDLRRITSSGDYAYDLSAELIQAVGGAATVWGGMTDRFHPHDFHTRSRYGFAADWPIGYDQLERYYARAEARLGVSGADEGDPFAAPRSGPHPLPPFELSWDVKKLASRLRSAGLALTASPQARTRAAYDGRPACANIGACETCPIGARYSPNHHLNQALASGRLKLHARATVRRIDVDAAGRARALVYRPNDEDRDREQPADVILVAAGALESARLLLLSSSGRHPNGLGNASGQLGQNLLFHHFWGGRLEFDEDLYPGRIGAEMGQSRQFLDPPTRGRHGGVLWQLPSASAAFTTIDRSRWQSGADVLASLAGLARIEAVGFHAETAPSPHKRLTLGAVKDRFGDPFAHIEYVSSEFDRATHAYAQSLLEKIAGAAGAKASTLDLAEAANSGYHHLGTCRMSVSEREGVVDPLGRVHGVSGLYVTGGAVFPSSGTVHPTLTMVALALRTADHLIETLK